MNFQNGIVFDINWLTQLFVAQLFIAGFVNFYTQVWNRGFGDLHKSRKKRIFYRFALVFLSAGLGFLLFIAGVTSPSSTAAMAYHNMSLFVVILAVLDEGINRGEFLVRCLNLLILWLLNHGNNLQTQRFGVSILIMLFILLLIWNYRHQIESHFVLRIIVCVALAFDFWFTLPVHLNGLTVTLSVSVQAVVMFFLMKLSTGNQQALWEHNVQLEHLANHDRLTNTKNYGAYQKDVFNGFGVARTKQQPLTLAILDIDHFKLINDAHGHLAGNKVLVDVANLLKKVLIQYNDAYQLYRTGGEEFVIIFPDCTDTEALPVLNHCWSAIHNTSFSYEKQQIKVTISVGATEIIDMDKSADDTYERADKSLYISKKHGRDAVTVNGKVSDLTTNLEHKRYIYFTKGVYGRNDDGTQKRMVNDLLLRSFDPKSQKWVIPAQDYLGIDMRITLMKDALINSRNRMIIVTLSVADFLNSDVAHKVVAFFNSADGPDQLFIELKQIPTTTLLKAMVDFYHKNKIFIMLSKINDNRHFEKIATSLKYVDGVKLTVHANNEVKFPLYLRKDVQFWGDIAKKAQVIFVVDGIDNESMVTWLLSQDNVNYLEGDYFGKAVMPLLKD